MGRRKKWVNEEMWKEAAQWGRGGAAYSDIAGRLARPENLKRFGLVEPPSEDTVRRELRRRLGGDVPVEDISPAGQVWRDKHIAELFYFGQRLRDRLSLDMPHEMAWWAEEERPFSAMWSHRSLIDLQEEPQDSEEQAVEAGWGLGRYDARQHPLFPAFQQHLSGPQCWRSFDLLQEAFNTYAMACQRAHGMIASEVKGRLPDLDEQYREAMTQSLLCHTSHRSALGTKGIEFSYEPLQVQDKDGAWWYLRLGAWGVGHAEEPEALRPVILAHQQLVQDLPSTAEIQKLAEAYHLAAKARERFQKDLAPDALLRKLVLNGRCQWCP